MWGMAQTSEPVQQGGQAGMTVQTLPLPAAAAMTAWMRHPHGEADMTAQMHHHRAGRGMTAQMLRRPGGGVRGQMLTRHPHVVHGMTVRTHPRPAVPQQAQLLQPDMTARMHHPLAGSRQVQMRHRLGGQQAPGMTAQMHLRHAGAGMTVQTRLPLGGVQQQMHHRPGGGRAMTAQMHHPCGKQKEGRRRTHRLHGARVLG